MVILSEASQQNISAKAEKLLRIFDRITAIELTIDLKDSNSPRVDAKLSAEHKHDFVAHDQSDNLMGSVDAVLHRLEQQLRKYKEKVQERHRQPDARRRGAAPGAEDSRRIERMATKCQRRGLPREKHYTRASRTSVINLSADANQRHEINAFDEA